MPTTAAANSTSTALIVWNDVVESQVRAAIACGKSVGSKIVKIAPKGFIARLRGERREKLRGASGAMLGALQQQGFRVEAFDGSYDPESKEFTANRVRKNGDEVLSIKLVKQAETAEQKELATLRDELSKAHSDLEAFRLAASAKK